MPLLETKGAASAQGFGLTLQQAAPVYIEDVFSTWLYTGNGSTQTITTGIDVAGKGGLIWLKNRSNSGYDHCLQDTARGITNSIYTNYAFGQNVSDRPIDSASSTGFTLNGSGGGNGNSMNYVSWTFRKQPKFFDVVTYTGNGASGRSISHSLQSTPGFIAIKPTSATGNWICYARASDTQVVISPDSVASFGFNRTGAGFLYTGSMPANSTTFEPSGLDYVANTNASGVTYVAYLFAHNAGGFGLTGTDNAITCGSFTADGSGNATISNLGYEPQWVLIKSVDFTDGWYLLDNMRRWAANGVNYLFANTFNAEVAGSNFSRPTANGFVFNYGTGANNKNFIYIAIRRGPMKTPTTGTSVFSPNAFNSPAGTQITTNFAADTIIGKYRTDILSNIVIDRLRRMANENTTSQESRLETNNSNAEDNGSSFNPIAYQVWNTGYKVGSSLGSVSDVFYSFRRAPGFFDVVCYTGNGSGGYSVSHNLGVTPQWAIIKRRDSSSALGWFAVRQPGAGNDLLLNSSGTGGYNSMDSWSATSFVLTSGYGDFNASGGTYVAYLFASCPGVSKVGSYTGTGALQTINCGFTGGARFVLIKRTDASGDWFVYDSARGISSGNDPYFLLNSSAAEVTGTNYVDTTSVGFQVTAAAPAGLNANGGTYIFLAIA